MLDVRLKISRTEIFHSEKHNGFSSSVVSSLDVCQGIYIAVLALVMLVFGV